MKRLLLIAFFLPAPADAHWRYTQWGNSVDEVIAQSNGTAHRVRDEGDNRVRDLHRLAEGEVTEGDTSLTAEFYFDEQGKALSLVRYQPVSALTCPEKEALYVRLFGEGQATSETKPMSGNLGLMIDRREWKSTEGDRIRFNRLRLSKDSTGACALLIEPDPETGAPQK